MGMFQWMRQVSKLGSQDPGAIFEQSTPQQLSFIRQLQKDLKKEQPLTRQLKDLQVTVLDLETSGFFPDRGDQILSIGGVKIKEGKVQNEKVFYSLVNAPHALSEEISELTGLRKDELEKAPSLARALNSFYRFAGTDVLVAHHASHERKFLQHATYQVLGSQFRHRLLDTSFLLKIAAPDVPLKTLDDCCNHYGIPIEKRHHALEDALITAELWKCMVEIVERKGYQTLQEIYAFLNS
ncbi:exonuclease domain-containing protein [Thalassobacillus sp. C254]|uniref:exonuclease domain-containing protein n=1 Tax=Thalassobacillus sp. C254 TaxID=1225341 RepID=UPI0006D00A7D|nr:exonuclease domain-containing protein [Thalassobacillus sp. C254]